MDYQRRRRENTLVATDRFLSILAMDFILSPGQSSYQRREMFKPIVRTHGVDLATLAARSLAQALHADNHVGARVQTSRSKCSQIPKDIDPLAAHALFHLETLLLDAWPILVDRVHLDIGVT